MALVHLFVHLISTSMDPQGQAVDQALRRLAAGGFQNVAERLTGDAHPIRGLHVIQAFEVGQPESLELVQGESDILEG